MIGNNVSLKANGAIKGLVVAQKDISISAQQNVTVTAIGSGNVNVSSGGTISGTIVGVGNVSVSGASVDAAMLSQGNVSANNASGRLFLRLHFRECRRRDQPKHRGQQ